MNLQEMEAQQERLAKQIEVPQQGPVLQKGQVCFALDIQYGPELAHVALVAWAWEGASLGQFVCAAKAEVEYVPGFFGFREAPLLLNLVDRVKSQVGLQPELLLVDGHGIAHPRRFGVASLVGLEAGVPTIGCAKETLLPYPQDPGAQRGEVAPVLLHGEVVGEVLRTQTGVRPVYVSPGHRVSLAMARQTILALTPTYRISEPLRAADQLARKFAREEPLTGATLLI